MLTVLALLCAAYSAPSSGAPTLRAARLCVPGRADGDGAQQRQTRRRAAGARRPARRGKKRMPQQAGPARANNKGPIMDAPNRMEIDPGDILPADRPRDPNVDDRTKIPAIIDPNDMAPRPKPTPKKKRPPQK